MTEKGLYRDGKPFQTSVKPSQWLPADKEIETFSPHVNLLAVLYDLAPRPEQAAIVERVLAQKALNTQPWFMHWVFQAIDHAGLFEKHATAQMRRWRIVRETQSFKEMWTGGDLSHGWCSTPLVQMSGRVLGIAPAEPGFRRIAIRPALCDLTWAKGSVPTPHGSVSVSWTLAEGKLHLAVTLPPDTEADVTVPTGRFEGAVVTADGRQVVGANPTVHVTAGTHQFVVTGTLKPALVARAADARTGKETTAADCDAFEVEVVKNDLIHSGSACRLVRVEEHCSHTGGGSNTSALLNGTTCNGEGSSETVDDGHTFRGYGAADYLVFHLDTAKSKAGYDLTRLLSFAGHSDARASQRYTVSFAFVSASPTLREIPPRRSGMRRRRLHRPARRQGGWHPRQRRRLPCHRRGGGPLRLRERAHRLQLLPGVLPRGHADEVRWYTGTNWLPRPWRAASVAFVLFQQRLQSLDHVRVLAV